FCVRVAAPDVLVADQQVVGGHIVGQTGLDRVGEEVVVVQVLGVVAAQAGPGVGPVGAQPHGHCGGQGQPQYGGGGAGQAGHRPGQQGDQRSQQQRKAHGAGGG